MTIIAMCLGGCVGQIEGDEGGGVHAGDYDGAIAFPGAQGFGAVASGGRGGRVIKVSTLAPTGPGSLQEALDRDEPRIIVFEVSGVIAGDLEIPFGDVTIAGQTAPGGGVTIAGRLSAAYRYGVDNIIIRHLRVRPAYDGSAGEQFDAVQLSRCARLILDHVSVSFGVDETVDLYEARDVTVQWSTITSSATRGHPEGLHNYGLISGPDGGRISVHHNLFAHHKNRAPAIANGEADVRNNVVYNVRHGFVHHNPASGPFNIVGNYYKAGPDDTLFPFYFDDEAHFSDDALRYYLRDNTIDDPSAICQGSIDDPWTECSYDLFADSSRRADAEFNFTALPYVPIGAHTSAQAYDVVLASAGALPRDVVTRAAVSDTEARAGSWGAFYPDDLMQGLTPGSPPEDTDDDGMPDDWEISRGLDPDDPGDAALPLVGEFTAIEVYINQLADALLP